MPLGSVTDILLDEGASPGALDAAAGELYDRLAAIRTPRSRDGSSLPGGKALSPVDAASCIRDARRTAVFLRGVNEAIRRFAGRPIELVYAGTGPFAPLAVPLMPRLPAGVRFTFIDAHAESIDCLAAILGRLGLRGTLVIGDAARYRHPTAPHVVIAEVMQRALSVEGQVAITRNLAPQLAPGGIFVPRRVTVDLAVADPQQPRTMQRVGRIVNLTAATARRALPPRRLRLPAIPPGHRAAYATRVVAYGRHALEAFESGLTQPAFIWHLGGEREVCFRYDETASAVTEM